MKKIMNSPNAPAPVGPYNLSVAFNNVLYASGQIALDPATGNMMQDDIEKETHQVMKNIKAILDNASIGFEDIIKCSVFVSDMNNYGRINTVYATYFDDATAPARELVEVSRLPKDANVEISIIAALPQK